MCIQPPFLVLVRYCSKEKCIVRVRREVSLKVWLFLQMNHVSQSQACLYKVLNYVQKEKASQKSLFQQMKQQWVQFLHKHCCSFSSLGFFCDIISTLTFIALWFVLNKMRSTATDHIELLPQDAPFLQRGGGLCDDRVLQRHHALTQPRVGEKRTNLGSIFRILLIIS